MSEHIEPRPTRRTFGLGRRGSLALAGAGLLALGGTGGAVVMARTAPSASMAPASPVPIRSLASEGIVTIRGRVAEIYGNKFVLADGTGRMLVDTGRTGDDRQLVAGNQLVTVQGRFDHGLVHAAFLVGPDNKVLALAPLAAPPHEANDRRGEQDCGPAAIPASRPGAKTAEGRPAPVAGSPAAPVPGQH